MLYFGKHGWIQIWIRFGGISCRLRAPWSSPSDNLCQYFKKIVLVIFCDTHCDSWQSLTLKSWQLQQIENDTGQPERAGLKVENNTKNIRKVYARLKKNGVKLTNAAGPFCSTLSHTHFFRGKSYVTLVVAEYFSTQFWLGNLFNPT